MKTMTKKRKMKQSFFKPFLFKDQSLNFDIII